MPEQPPGPHDTWYKLGCSFLMVGALAGAWYLDLGQSVDAYRAERERLGREEMKREYERKIQHARMMMEAEARFMVSVDKNHDGYFAPGEITSWLRACGYSAGGESGLVYLTVDKSPHADAIRRVEDYNRDGPASITYRVSPGFIEECVKKQERKENKNPTSP